MRATQSAPPLLTRKCAGVGFACLVHRSTRGEVPHRKNFDCISPGSPEKAVTLLSAPVGRTVFWQAARLSLQRAGRFQPAGGCAVLIAVYGEGG